LPSGGFGNTYNDLRSKMPWIRRLLLRNSKKFRLNFTGRLLEWLVKA
jgi:hypothetical protein